jgi:hypothetical protein
MHRPFPVLGVVLSLLGVGGLVCGPGLLPGMGPGMMRGPAGWGMMGEPRLPQNAQVGPPPACPW